MPAPTFEQWIEREPRLSTLISTMKNVGCTNQQIATTVPVLAFLLEDGKGPLAIPGAAMLAAAPAVARATAPAATAPASPAAPAPVVASKPKPTAIGLLSPTKVEPPKRTFERALATVVRSCPGFSLNEPKQADAPVQKPQERARRWDSVMRKVTCSNPNYSMPSGVAYGSDDPVTFRQLIAAEAEARGGLVEIDGETSFDPAILLELMDEISAEKTRSLSPQLCWGD